MVKPNLLLIKTGGTIGGCVPEYIEIEQIANLFQDTIDFKKHITQSFKAAVEFSEVEVCKKDSRDINDNDRTIIVKQINKAFLEDTKMFLITHGTFTMAQTGAFLIENLAKDVRDNSLIVLTGSMYPWNVFGSDAPLNLGASISQLVSSNSTGVWLCMHGRMLDPLTTKKDIEKLIFD